MRFEQTAIEGVRRVVLDRNVDQRGQFMRTWCAATFELEGLRFHPVQSGASVTYAKGTIRGMHFQHAPCAETKLVRCSRGRIWDVVVDLRPTSQTHRRSVAVELNERDGTALYIPKGCAHGFQALEDNVTVEYVMDEVYAPDLADGFRYDDPAADIDWPLPAIFVSERDLAWTPLAKRNFWKSAARAEAAML